MYLPKKNETNETNQARVTNLVNGHCLGFENLSNSQCHLQFFIPMPPPYFMSSWLNFWHLESLGGEYFGLVASLLTRWSLNWKIIIRDLKMVFDNNNNNDNNNIREIKTGSWFQVSTCKWQTHQNLQINSNKSCHLILLLSIDPPKMFKSNWAGEPSFSSRWLPHSPLIQWGRWSLLVFLLQILLNFPPLPFEKNFRATEDPRGSRWD